MSLDMPIRNVGPGGISLGPTLGTLPVKRIVITQGILVTSIGILSNSAIVSAAIGGCFLTLNTLLNVYLLRRYGAEEREREKEDGKHPKGKKKGTNDKRNN